MWLFRAIVGSPDESADSTSSTTASSSKLPSVPRAPAPPIFSLSASDASSVFDPARSSFLRAASFDSARVAQRQLCAALSLCHAALGEAEAPEHLAFSDSVALDVFTAALPALLARASTGPGAKAAAAASAVAAAAAKAGDSVSESASAVGEQIQTLQAAASAAAVLRRRGALPGTPALPADRAALEASVTAFAAAHVASLGVTSPNNTNDSNNGNPAKTPSSWQSASPSSVPASDSSSLSATAASTTASQQNPASASASASASGSASDSAFDDVDALAASAAATALRERRALARAAELSHLRRGLGLDAPPPVLSGSGSSSSSSSGATVNATAAERDAVADDLLELSAALKDRVRGIAGALAADRAVLDGVDTVTEALETGLRATSSRLARFLDRQGWGGCCGQLAMLAAAVAMLMLAVVVIKVVPKPRW